VFYTDRNEEEEQERVRELIVKTVVAVLVIFLLGQPIESAGHSLGVYLDISEDQLPVFQDFVLAVVVGIIIMFPIKRIGL